jgi:putative sigma-54 modulation protein
MTKKIIKVTGLTEVADKAAKKYAEKRVENLFKYLPRHARRTATGEVKLEQVNHDHGNKYEAEIILKVPNKTITARDSTSNIMAAIDIVEAKIKSQLKTYKATMVSHNERQHIISRFKRSLKRQI